MNYIKEYYEYLNIPVISKLFKIEDDSIVKGIIKKVYSNINNIEITYTNLLLHKSYQFNIMGFIIEVMYDWGLRNNDYSIKVDGVLLNTSNFCVKKLYNMIENMAKNVNVRFLRLKTVVIKDVIDKEEINFIKKDARISFK